MRNIKSISLYLACIGVASYAVAAYGFLPLGSVVHPEMTKNFLAQPVGVYTHIFGSAIALFLGPLQLSDKFRSQYPEAHRNCGKLYLIAGVLVGGLSGLYIAQSAFGGLTSQLGFSTLAILWLLSGLLAYSSIRKGQVHAHRKWMLRNFALTFAAVTLRVYLGLFSLAGFEFASFYPLVSWLCWVPNIIFIEVFYKSTHNDLVQKPAKAATD